MKVYVLMSQSYMDYGSFEGYGEKYAELECVCSSMDIARKQAKLRADSYVESIREYAEPGYRIDRNDEEETTETLGQVETYLIHIDHAFEDVCGEIVPNEGISYYVVEKNLEEK